MSLKEKDFLDLLDKRVRENKSDLNKWGVMTPYVKSLAGYLSVNPWRVVVPLSIVVSFFIYWLLDGSAVGLVSFLQGMF